MLTCWAQRSCCKPTFDLNALINTILQHVDTRLHSTQTPSATSDLPHFITELAQTYQVDVETALNRLGGKLSLYLRMLQMFLSDLSEAEKRACHKSQMIDNSTAS